MILNANKHDHIGEFLALEKIYAYDNTTIKVRRINPFALIYLISDYVFERVILV